MAKNKSIDIQYKTEITNWDSGIKFGNYIYIGPFGYIMAKGKLTIGDNVIIGPKVFIWTENHNFKSEKMIPYDELNVSKEVIIEENVWIGAEVKICPGTIIGEGSIVGMGSVVRGEIPPCSIVFGNPAKVISTRDRSIYNKLKAQNKQYYKIKKSKNEVF